MKEIDVQEVFKNNTNLNFWECKLLASIVENHSMNDLTDVMVAIKIVQAASWPFDRVDVALEQWRRGEQND